MTQFPRPKLSELFFGYIDGKHEFNEIDEETFERGFYAPAGVTVKSLVSGSKFLISGPRGTGKTTLLRWIAHSSRQTHIISFLLFKSDVSEAQKQDYSRAQGIKELRIEGLDKGVSQDFRDLWRIIYATRICISLMENTHAIEDIKPVRAILRLAGIERGTAFESMLPNILKLVRAKWSDVSSGVEWEVGLWGAAPLAGESMSIGMLATTLLKIFKTISFKIPVLLLVDELEIFFKSQEQFNRDCDLIRDSIFVAEEFRSTFKNMRSQSSIITCLRDEVIKAIGARGEEIYKVVDDYSININWSDRKASKDHSLLKLFERKIPSTLEDRRGFDFHSMFPHHIHGIPYYQYLTDNTCCKPRNIVSRLRVIQDRYPEADRITSEMFEETESEYSSRVWKEVEYLLGASLSEPAVSAIRRVMFGGAGRFTVHELESRMKALERSYPKEIGALRDEGLISSLERLFEYGAIGNVYYDNDSKRTMYIWSFRQEPLFQPDKGLEIQQSLRKHLSIVKIPNAK